MHSSRPRRHRRAPSLWKLRSTISCSGLQTPRSSPPSRSCSSRRSSRRAAGSPSGGNWMTTMRTRIRPGEMKILQSRLQGDLCQEWYDNEGEDHIKGFQEAGKLGFEEFVENVKINQHQHNKQMSCPAMGQLLSNTLYYKHFFPCYAFNVLGGLDSEGKGCVFTYDVVGSYERVGYSAQGSGSTLIMPVLDNQLTSPSPLLLPARDDVTPLSESEAVDLVKYVFTSAAERDIYTGDKLEVIVINSSGIKREFIELRKD